MSEPPNARITDINKVPENNPMGLQSKIQTSSDSLYYEAAATVPSMSSESETSVSVNPPSTVQGTDNMMSIQSGLKGSPLSNKQSPMPALQSQEDDSEDYKTPTDEGNGPSKELNTTKHALVERTHNEIHCIQSVIDARCIPLESIIEKVKRDIENGVYNCTKPSETKSTKKDNQLSTVSSDKAAAPVEQPFQSMPDSNNVSQSMPVSTDNSQQFYSTTSTPKMARTSKRTSPLASADKKKNCIIL